MAQLQRAGVICVTPTRIPRASFDERGLILSTVGLDQVKVAANSARAILIAEGPDKVGAIRSQLERLTPLAADYGLAFAILVGAEKDIVAVNRMLREMGIESFATVRMLPEIRHAAEFIRCHDPGPIVGDVAIEPASLKLTDDDRILFRRAFFDCKRIFLEKLPGGRASMSAFRVHAWLLPEWCIAGPRPLPFFVKISDPVSIETEKKNYRVYAEHFIPFNFRPNIDHRRCVRTWAGAALAGDFVDDAVPLRKCLKLGLATGALFALFETSLKGFRLQPFASDKKPQEGALAGFVKNRIKADKVIKQIIDRAKSFHFSSTPEEMQSMICKSAEKLPCLMGPCHGDLHAGNVMVRGGDAILIDFFSAGDGPLTADPAALEVSLMFGTDEDDRVDTFEEWRALTDQIYDPKLHTLHPPALSESKPGPFSWLRRSIRELRHILLGCKVDEVEAKIVLAAYMLRYARLGKEALCKKDTVAFDRHAYALVVAERIVTDLSAGSAVKGDS